jgi:hypothetical protein
MDVIATGMDCCALNAALFDFDKSRNDVNNVMGPRLITKTCLNLEYPVRLETPIAAFHADTEVYCLLQPLPESEQLGIRQHFLSTALKQGLPKLRAAGGQAVYPSAGW